MPCSFEHEASPIIRRKQYHYLRDLVGYSLQIRNERKVRHGNGIVIRVTGIGNQSTKTKYTFVYEIVNDQTGANIDLIEI